MIFYINAQNELYVGDCAISDRVATAEEVAAWQASRSPSFAAQKAAERALWKGQREQFMGRLASIASRLRVADPVGAASADAVATDLLGLFKAPAVLAAKDIATYKAALVTRYKQSVALATPSTKTEFDKYNK